jgi:rhodanese-related sulfurtransferase/predicted enzyme related to lactoylglutathione lyase
MSPDGVVVLDVREGEERLHEGTVPGSLHVPRGRLELEEEGLDTRLPPGRTVVVVCADGRRAALAAATLSDLGSPRVVVLSGGFAAWVAAGGPVERFGRGAEHGAIEGLGGAFFKATDPGALIRWYGEALGLEVDTAYNCATFDWRFADSERAGSTVFSIFPSTTEYFGSSDQAFMVNLRVRDLDAVLDGVRAHGGVVAGGPDDSDYGRFAWVVDPEGNRVELWEAPSGV